MYKKECESSGRPFAVFTPYPENWDGVCSEDDCLAEQPCQVPCGHTGCTVSAFVRESESGKRVIEYFLVGPDHACADHIRALSFAANNTVEYNRKCIAHVDKMHCGHIAPYANAHEFVDLSSSSLLSSDDESAFSGHSLAASASSSSSESSDSADSKCLMKEDWCTKQRQSRFLVTFKPGYRGVVVEVPDDFVIAIEPVHLLLADGATYRCTKACVLELPVPKCGNTRCDGESSSGDLCAQLGGAYHHAPAQAPVQFVPRVGAPAPLAVADGDAARLLAEPTTPARCALAPSVVLAAREVSNTRGAEARDWLEALEEQAFALAHCSRAPAPDSQEAHSLALGTGAQTHVGSCDLTRCRAALLRRSRLTGDLVPSTAAGFVARARALATSARESYASERFNEARQAACCAELLFEELLAHYDCPVEHCNVAHVYPRNALFESDERRRSQRPDGTVRAELQPSLTMVAFEECDVTDNEQFVPDNDANDAVFAVYATSMVGSVTKRWFATALHVEARALGTTSDFALELRFVEAHVPSGSRVRVLHHGAAGGAAAEECWTANSHAAATHDCPSTDVIRLVRSVRTALPRHESSYAPFVNTLAGRALAEPAHSATVYIEVPSTAVQVHAEPTFKLVLELRDRATDCTVRSLSAGGSAVRGVDSARGFGVLAPAHFRWPLEGVPAFLNETLLPNGGLCVGGDRARGRCNEADECAGGFCELRSWHIGRHHCYDAPLPGMNEAALCSRPSACPYGRCYGRDAARDTEMGAYPLLGAHLDAAASGGASGASARWYARSGAQNEQLLYDADAYRSRNNNKK